MSKSAPRKRASKPNLQKEAEPEELNIKRELFCRYYTQNEELFGNATLSYAEAYGYKLDELSREAVYEQVFNEETGEYQDGDLIEPSDHDKAYHVCSVEANRLLRNPDIQKRMTALLNELLADEVVDSQLAKVIMQDGDLPPKIRAIAEYNKLRGRIIDHSKVTHVQKLDMDDIRVLIGVLPQERQDQFYATITDILAEAELLRSGTQSTSGNPQRPGEHTA